MSVIRSLACSFAIICASPAAFAQADISVGVAQIIAAAENICGKIQTDGSGSNLELQGEADAELKRLSRLLLDLGIEGAAKLSEGEYSGVLREQLGLELQDNRRCREKVFDAMFAVVFSATPETVLDEEQFQALEGRVRPHQMDVIASGNDFSMAPGETVTLNGNALIFSVDRIGFYTSNNRAFVYYSYVDGQTGNSATGYVYQPDPIKTASCNIIPYRIDNEQQQVSFRLFCN